MVLGRDGRYGKRRTGNQSSGQTPGPSHENPWNVSARNSGSSRNFHCVAFDDIGQPNCFSRRSHFYPTTSLSSTCYVFGGPPRKHLADLMLPAEHPKPCEISKRDFITLNRQVVECQRRPRLISHCREVAVTKRRAYLDWDYWGKPVPSFGDPSARLLILGLAPGAHGANRTGRMFTGDRSGEFLYRSLHKAGFASQPESRSVNDGLSLTDAWITAAAHCAPPDNKPTPLELRNCRPFLDREMEILHTFKLWSR